VQPEAATVRPLVMADVAARAGVSHQTVSRVINGHPSVAPHTRERVEQAIAELGYRPNIAARALVTGSTRTIGLVTVKINQYGPAQTMLGLEKAARAAGYSLSVSILDEATAAAMKEAVDTFVGQRVDAIIALSTYDDAAESLGVLEASVPLVAVQAGGDEERPAVGVDQETGARLATRHLLDLGHRTVHHVTGPVDSQEARARIAGWRAELEAAGAAVPELLRGDWTPSSGFAAGRQLADRIRAGDDVTAIFLANDQMALGLLAALHESGLEAPDDVSVVGFDDLPEAP
jgi:DNA-binding LacI/PurR family transcriptional regulator